MIDKAHADQDLPPGPQVGEDQAEVTTSAGSVVRRVPESWIRSLAPRWLFRSPVFYLRKMPHQSPVGSACALAVT